MLKSQQFTLPNTKNLIPYLEVMKVKMRIILNRHS